MDEEHVSYKQDAKVGKTVRPEDLPALRKDDEPTRDAVLSKGQGAGARNVDRANPRDAALETDE